jgi:hypothetical protein
MTSVQPARRVARPPRRVLRTTTLPVGAQASVVLPSTGLELPRALSFENWLRIGETLAMVQASTAWCLGDWLIYGETAYSGRYRDAVKQTSLDYQTLRNYAWVARRFPISRRRDRLSFGHHAEVASLAEPEQDFWLRKAEAFGWSTSRLRHEVRSSLSVRAARDVARPAAAGAAGPRDAQLRLQLSVLPVQLELCRAAADQAGLSIEEWAVRILYAAACQFAPDEE